jgi:hypothetical protein
LDCHLRVTSHSPVWPIALRPGSDVECRLKLACSEGKWRRRFPGLKYLRYDRFMQINSQFAASVFRASVTYRDDRFGSHSLLDFTIVDDDFELPINVKNAGTRFENAAMLVGLDPDDCIPIPAYKAYDAIEKAPNLLYAISVDYALLGKIESQLLTRLSQAEAHVWRVLNHYAGALIRDAEDRFVYSTVNRHWEDFSGHVSLPVFRVISARKAVRILQTQPKRTPGIGLRAWGTGASAEVNVHVSITSETKAWDEIPIESRAGD